MNTEVIQYPVDSPENLPVESRDVVKTVILAIRRENAKQMEEVKLELRAITNDNSVLRQNLALLNTGMANFQRELVIPLRSELQNLREEQGGRTIENARKLEALIQALTKSMELAGTIIPQDLKDQIADGHFEDLDHRKADESHGSEIRGYVPEHVVQSMIDAAVRKALTERGNHEAIANDGHRQEPDA